MKLSNERNQTQNKQFFKEFLERFEDLTLHN